MKRADLEPHDLVVSKAIAGRDKDVRFLRGAVAHGLVDPAVLLERLAATVVDEARRRAARDRIELQCAANHEGGMDFSLGHRLGGCVRRARGARRTQRGE